MVAQKIPNGSLESAKAKVIVRTLYHWTGKFKRMWIPTNRQRIDVGSSRVRQTYEFANFVERLPRRIVHGRPQQPVV